MESLLVYMRGEAGDKPSTDCKVKCGGRLKIATDMRIVNRYCMIIILMVDCAIGKGRGWDGGWVDMKRWVIFCLDAIGE